MTTDQFSVVDPTEKNVLNYVFANGLETGETLVAPTVLVTVVLGTDAGAQSRVGTPQISGSSVLVPFSGQLNGVDYDIKVTVTTSNPSKSLALAKVLPCRLL